MGLGASLMRKIMRSTIVQPFASKAKQVANRIYARLFPLRIVDLNSQNVKRKVLVDAKRVKIEEGPACEYLHFQSYAPVQDYSVWRRETYIAELNNIVFWVKPGLLITTEGKFILDAGVDHARIKTIYSGYRRRRPRRLPGAYTSIWGQFTHNYGHWMIECLLRLYSLKIGVDKDVTLLMPSNLSPVQRDSFNICLPSGTRVIYVDPNEQLLLEKYFYLSHPTSGTSFFLPPNEYLEYARTCTFRHYNLDSHGIRRNRVYIRRRKANYRHVLNEDEVIELLKPYGFVSYDLEDLSFQQQVTLFHDLDVVVSPHSSGLINLIFAPREARVVELSSLAPEPSFFFLTVAMNQRYHYLFAQEADPAYSFPKRNLQPQLLRQAINSDFTVPLSELLDIIRHIETY